MAKIIPENLRSRKDIRHAIGKTAAVFGNLPSDASVWYEPIFDPSGEKPDFVIWLPDRGIAVLEILDAKIESILDIKRRKITLLRDGEPVEMDNPINRASKFAEQLCKSISNNSDVSSLKIEVASAACLPLLSEEDSKRKGFSDIFDPSFTIFADDLDEFDNSVFLSAIERLLGPSKFGFSAELDKIIRSIVQPDIVINSAQHQDEQSRIFQASEKDREQVRVMDREQESLAKSLGDGHRIIRGVAGSGKTLVLVFRAKLLARCNPRSSYLLVCYTKTLAGQLRRLLEKFPNIEVANFDKLVWDFSGKKHTNKYDFNANLVAANAAVSAGGGSRYDGILVDEAQDLTTESLSFLTKLFKNGCDDLIIVADAAQNIFRRKFSWKQAGIQAQGRTRMLRINYRNTREILEFASSFLLTDQNTSVSDLNFEDENTMIPPESSKRSGKVPEVVFVNDVLEEVEETVRRVKQELSTLGPGQKITILYPGNDVRKRGRTLHRQLDYHRIKHFWIEDERAAKALLGSVNESVILCTVQSAKGLEFPRVIVCGIWWEGGDEEVNRKLSYVAMTRATDELLVISRTGHKLERDLLRAIERISTEQSGSTIDSVESTASSIFTTARTTHNPSGADAVLNPDGEPANHSQPPRADDADDRASDESVEKNIIAVFGHSKNWLSSDFIYECVTTLYDFEGSPSDIRRACFRMRDKDLVIRDKRNLWQLKKNLL